MTPRFLYFDLGNVLLHFDHHQACRQMGEVAGLPVERVWQIVFDGDLEQRYESGQIDDRQFHELFCRESGKCPGFDALLHAASDIFAVNLSIVPVVIQLKAAGWPLGILSNTCPAHWNYCTDGRFGVLRIAYRATALSFRIGACKPDAKIFQAAAELAGVAPAEIFYVDDIPGHVVAARAAGFDAVQYTTTPALVEDLRSRGVRFNY